MHGTVPRPEQLTGGVLAGGQGRRLGGVDKGWLRLHGRPLIEHVVTNLAPKVCALSISANRNLAAYRRVGELSGLQRPVEVHPDAREGYPGPMAGLHTLMMRCRTRYLVVIPVDAVVLPPDLVERLTDALIVGSAGIAVATTSTGPHYTACLLDCHRLEPPPPHGRVRDWMSGAGFVEAPMPASAVLSVNTERELALLGLEMPGGDGGKA